jgi:hypothetical protein
MYRHLELTIRGTPITTPNDTPRHRSIGGSSPRRVTGRRLHHTTGTCARKHTVHPTTPCVTPGVMKARALRVVAVPTVMEPCARAVCLC